MKSVISGGFWKELLAGESGRSLPHQWEMMEDRGTIENFRIAAGLVRGSRRGFFYTDSDLHKWAEAAARFIAGGFSRSLGALLDEYAGLMLKAQEDDGYIFTWNQIFFPGTRWVNLQIEHELYCMGHFIEAGIAHRRATGRDDLFIAARKTADLICRRFAASKETSGHQEIELALLNLYEETGDRLYLEGAGRFIENRGRARFHALSLARQFISHGRRNRQASRQVSSGDHVIGFDLSENRAENEVPFVTARFYRSVVTGEYNQNDAPVRELAAPRGHAVRWAYYLTAAARYARLTEDRELKQALVSQVQHAIDRKMYISGGIGSLPLIEGFGNDYELDNLHAYSETCAAIGFALLCHEMGILTGEALYADMVEWLAYNATMVSQGEDQASWFYRNPLESVEGKARRPWYETACCPSNLSRFRARFANFVLTAGVDGLTIDHYLNTAVSGEHFSLKMKSAFPWKGSVSIELKFPSPAEKMLRLHIPGWALDPVVSVNGRGFESPSPESDRVTAGGFSPYGGRYLTLERRWEKINLIELEFPMPVVTHRGNARVKDLQGKTALSRGPVLYCAEESDHGPGYPRIDTGGSYLLENDKIGSTTFPRIIWTNRNGAVIRFIPYYLWGNRDKGWMKIWLDEY